MNNNSDDKKYYIQEENSNNYNIVIMAIGSFFLVIFLIFIFSDNELNINTIKVFSFFFLIWIFLCLIMRNDYSKIENYKNIVNTGIKVDGQIKSFKKVYPMDNSDNISVAYVLIINYKDPNTNVEKEFETPNVNFNPLTDLVSKKCSVYVDGNKAYATDFEINKNINNNIWQENELEHYNKQVKLERKINIIATPITIIEIIFFVFLFYQFIKYFFFSR